MPRSDPLARIDRQIAIVADLRDQHCQTIRRMKAAGRDANAAQMALDSLDNVLRQRLIERMDIENADGSARKRRA